uniref:Putative peroxygenase 5 n=1 Tax=Anthurium amnicola TaxID=1678845 RepID=A0A1D1ZET5_9ARAE
MVMGRQLLSWAFAILIASPLTLPLHLVPPLVFLSVLSPSGASDMGASRASSLSSPAGTTAEASTGAGEMTPLQKHVSFFDRDKDGLIYPWETYQGFRAIGCGTAFSSASAVFINGFLGPKTQPENLASPLLPIYVSNIKKGKHAGDSGAYDTEGRFVPAKFEEIFQKHAHANPNALTSDELMEMLKANRDPKDYTAWIAAYTEWTTLYALCKDKDGLLPKETIRSVYDGSLFYQLEKERNASKGYNN